MYLARIDDASGEPKIPLDIIEAELRGLTGMLDARFSGAGQALANAYDIVERLIGGLDKVIHALDREAADAAIARMELTANRLMALPERQSARSHAFDTIRDMNGAIRRQVWKINRLLNFLRICGLNIKIAAAGAQDFADFAEIIFARIDLGEREMGEVRRTTEQLHASMAGVMAIEDRLAGECRLVIPAVPLKLAEDAQTLRRHQEESGLRADRSARMAREIRGHVAAAIGAMQIGDITRQRLEHVADGIGGMNAFLADRPDLEPASARMIQGHVLALLAAQAEDAVRDLKRDSRSLTDSVRAIGTDVTALLELHGAGGAASDSEQEAEGQGGSAGLFAAVERDVRQMATLMGQLQEADAQSNRLSNAASTTAADLARRARYIHRITNDVQQMAWNTDLRCHRMGDDGRALAAVAAEIRDLANQLAAISGGISHLFDRLEEVAASIRTAPADVADAGDALAGSLSFIRDGSDRLQTSFAALHEDVRSVARLLDGTDRKVDCEQLAASLFEIAGRLADVAAPCDPAHADIAPLLGELLAAIAGTYTMAREREIHRPFAGLDEVDEGGGAASSALAMADDDFDDGLF